MLIVPFKIIGHDPFLHNAGASVDHSEPAVTFIGSVEGNVYDAERPKIDVKNYVFQ